MGKGDKKTKRGKIVQGSYGVTRPHKKKNKEAAVHNEEKETKGDKKKEKIYKKK
jgi:30S ribosomal protein S31